MNYLLLVAVVWLSLINGAHGQPSIVFNLSPTGYPPYMFQRGDEPAKGIIYDVLKLVANKYDYKIVLTRIPKNREVLYLKSGDLDANALAKEWVEHPDDFEFSDVIVEARDVLFSLKAAPVKFNDIKDLYGKTIGIHLGYSYPLLAQGFDLGLFYKSNANSEEAMLGKVLVERTDVAVVNELVGHWLIKDNPLWHNKFVVSQREVGGFDYRIQFSKKWKGFVVKFNRELTRMKGDGQLKKIKARYK